MKKLKGTRARGLPPKVLLSRRQDATGSFPSVHRTSGDNRTGKYNVFFNDVKTIPFNISSGPAEIVISSTGLPITEGLVYEERTVEISSCVSTDVYFTSVFPHKPMVVITELNSTENNQNVKAFIIPSPGVIFIGENTTNFTVAFSSMFSGMLTYRAVYDPAPGSVHYAERLPTYPGQYTKIITKSSTTWSNPDTGFNVNFSNFGSPPPLNYVTLVNDLGNNSDVDTTITEIDNTHIHVEASSAPIDGTVYVNYLGAMDNVPTTSPTVESVGGLIYPIKMTAEQAKVVLAPEDYAELVKYPFFSSSELKNVPLPTVGSPTRTISDAFVTFTPGQVVESFRDSDNPAVDAKLTDNPFYATGSAVTTTGEGFQQPLWSKTKIEIPLDIEFPAYFGQSTYDDLDNLMAYYDFSQKTFVPIGDSRTNSQLVSFVNNYYITSKSIGFGTSTYGFFSNGPYDQLFKELTGAPVNLFGFPFDYSRYGITTPNKNGAINTNPNMLFSLEDILSEPFLLEKIVLEFDGEMHTNGIDDSGYCAMSTFFILNQTGNDLKIEENGYSSLALLYSPPPVPPTLSLYFDSNGLEYPITSSTSGIDLVSYLQIAALTSSLLQFYPTGLERDANVYQEAVDPIPGSYGLNPDFGYSGSFIVSSSVRSPTAYSYGNIFRTWVDFPVAQSILWNSLDNRYGGRKSIPISCGRNWKTSIPTQNPTRNVDTTFVFASTNITLQAKSYEENPYILLPKDKLIFGWQAPLANISGSYTGNCGKGPELRFPVGKGKITLYGSSLRVNPETNQLEEHHDTLNQLLTSETIHEVIG